MVAFYKFYYVYTSFYISGFWRSSLKGIFTAIFTCLISGTQKWVLCPSLVNGGTQYPSHLSKKNSDFYGQRRNRCRQIFSVCFSGCCRADLSLRLSIMKRLIVKMLNTIKFILYQPRLKEFIQISNIIRLIFVTRISLSKGGKTDEV